MGIEPTLPFGNYVHSVERLPFSPQSPCILTLYHKIVILSRSKMEDLNLQLFRPREVCYRITTILDYKITFLLKPIFYFTYSYFYAVG